ncbi:MAG TPA: Flp pilus assembly protein CpaB, partial [Pyrinomonadaceae bacterium]|nr:Flp pilus assembly protein CpaB [Pyrinomonadaceae bacterium]
VKVDDIVGVSGFVMPGSYVDVVAVIIPVSQNAAAKGPISKIVLQNIKVLASGANLDSPQDQRQPTDVKAVTLLVTPEQAEKLVLAANESKLQLVMRNYSDQEDSLTKGANKETLLGGDPVTAEPAPPSEKSLEANKVATPPKPRIKRASYVRPTSSTDKPAPPPVARKSVELIEGSKRRDVDVP